LNHNNVQNIEMVIMLMNEGSWRGGELNYGMSKIIDEWLKKFKCLLMEIWIQGALD
jgi:hypothetical protein